LWQKEKPKMASNWKRIKNYSPSLAIGSLLRRHRLSIIGQNFFQAKKLIAAMPAKTRRLWTSELNITGTLPSDNFVKPKFAGLYLQTRVSGGKVTQILASFAIPSRDRGGGWSMLFVFRRRTTMCEQSEFERILWF
jgi:hypothetical protein